MSEQKKKLIILLMAIVGSLILILPTAYVIMAQPLDLLYRTDKYGNFYVSSTNNNKYVYTVTFTSSWYLENWRSNLIRLLYNGDENQLQAKLVTKDKTFNLETHIMTSEPLIIVLKVRFDKGMHIWDYYRMNKYMKNIIENHLAEIELDKVFERPKD